MKKIVLAQILVLTAVLALSEAVLTTFLQHPTWMPHSLLMVARTYYMRADRKIIQFQPELAQYDKDLTYILKPGNHRFANREYNNVFACNSAGLRDDEASLQAPEIIVLGDSFALGWGVDQNESFPQVIERKTGKRVLNAGVSSYGTVRELLLLKRLDTSHLKHLIIQYCPNDFEENTYFRDHQGTLSITPAEEYERICKQHRKDTRYFLGKHTVGFARAAWDLWKHLKWQWLSPTWNPAPPRNAEEAAAFLGVLEHSKKELQPFTITVIDVERRGWNSPGFLQSLSSRDFHLKPLDLSRLLTAALYYTLDDHLTKEGQEAIADAWIAQVGM